MSIGAHSFFCDTMLGRLAKWLRLMGYDADYRNEIDDWEMLRLCRREGRLLLTRDTSIMERWYVTRSMVKALLVDGDDTARQLSYITNQLSLKTPDDPRCPECNLPLHELLREDARGRVPPYVYETQKEFRICSSCGRIYWKATHWDRIERVRKDPKALSK